MNLPEITPLNIGYLRADMSAWYDLPADHPLASRVEQLPLFAYHVALAGRSLLVDAPSYDFPPEEAEMAVPGLTPPSLLEQLSAAGIAPEAITDVVITHVHFDHYVGLSRLSAGGWVPAFPHARHYAAAADWQPDSFDEKDERTLGVVQEYGLLTLVEGRLDLGDGLTILPAPGETAGHQILHLRHSDLDAYFTGDLYHHPVELAEPERSVTWADPAAMQASKAALIEAAAASRAFVYFTHIEGAYQVERKGQTISWRRVQLDT